MMPVIWLIGGSREGRRLIKELAHIPVELYVSVATDYGAGLIEPQENLTVMAERMDGAAMAAFLADKQPACVIDATHPYATIVTATVQKACQDAAVTYLRLVRPSAQVGDYISVEDFSECVELLNHLEGNIFLTTGSKNLPDFVGVHNYAERIALRILPMPNSLATAIDNGYKPAHIVCMQGPFSKELNVAMFKKFGSKYVVTKDSGAVGGFDEKVEAAREAGAKLIVIERALEEKGAGYQEIVSYLHEHFGRVNVDK